MVGVGSRRGGHVFVYMCHCHCSHMILYGASAWRLHVVHILYPLRLLSSMTSSAETTLVLLELIPYRYI